MFAAIPKFISRKKGQEHAARHPGRRGGREREKETARGKNAIRGMAR